jgi:uncharacterized protein (UPF0297 family)
MDSHEGKTITFPASPGLSPAIRETIALVYAALRERGYDPVGQLAGYLVTGDPTYITAHNRARTEVIRVDRLEIIEEMVRVYLAQVEPTA